MRRSPPKRRVLVDPAADADLLDEIEGGIEILRVLHGSRDLLRILERWQ